MTRAYVGALAGLMLLAACESYIPKDQTRLLGACKFKDCACVKQGSKWLIGGPEAPLAWRANGDPYCPDGYFLRITEKRKDIYP